MCARRNLSCRVSDVWCLWRIYRVHACMGIFQGCDPVSYKNTHITHLPMQLHIYTCTFTHSNTTHVHTNTHTVTRTPSHPPTHTQPNYPSFICTHTPAHTQIMHTKALIHPPIYAYTCVHTELSFGKQY